MNVASNRNLGMARQRHNDTFGSSLTSDEGILDDGLAYTDDPSTGTSLEDLSLMASNNASPSLSNGSSSRKKSDCNLIVNYLPQTMSQEELRKLFSYDGNVQLESCKLIKDKVTGQSLSYGFVEFAHAEDALQAINTLNGVKIGNKNIKVSLARPSCETIKGANLYVSGIPKRWVERDFELFFAPYGDIITSRILRDNISGLSKGVGFVRFDQRQQAELAIKEANGVVPEGYTEPLQVKVANNPSATSTALAAAAAAAAAASVVSPSGKYGMSYGGLGGSAQQIAALQNPFLPALAAAFMQTGNPLSNQQATMNMAGLGMGGPQAFNLTGMQSMGSNNIGLSGLPSSSGTSHRSRAAAGVGPIHHQSSRVRYSPMGTSSDMLAASQLLNSNVNVMGGMASLGFPYGAGTMTATGPSTLFVFNLNPDVSETDLWQLFGPYGGVQNVKIARDPHSQKCRGFAFVTMTDAYDAAVAIQSLNGSMLAGRILQVSFKNSKK
ncbi:hypothetical protein RvY_17513 [Ramazzottius varieornatus]|uniref:RRM domain-containing protein n=1 Tax=Ramazzottius varieornatus TaxID=947166 RepID=A0A1D1W868_RAMVA|nr:hypothetical protein RvY_17513 [Ramazzottius varieornatus]